MMQIKPVILFEELSRAMIDRLADAGATALGLHPGGGENADRLLDGMLRMLKTDAYRELLDYAAGRGLEIVYEIHAGSWLVPRERFREHPGYFRQNEHGRRTKHLNFCPSNADALSLAADRAAELANALYRGAPVYSFWLDDGSGGRCRCAACRALSASDQQLRVVNAIARRLREDRPGAKVAYLAYGDTMPPPERETPEPGVFLEYAPIGRDLRAPASAVPEAEKVNLRALLRCFGARDAWLLEYWYDNSLFSGWKKPPKPFSADESTIRDDVAYYRGLGFSNIGTFYCWLGREYEDRYGAPAPRRRAAD